MGRAERTVFISYRRTNVAWALAVYQDLTRHGYDVFFDFTGMASGDFEQVILGNIKARAHFLVLLTPSALERVDEPGDWLRREIECAIREQRNIVPLFLEGFDFGAPAIAKRLTGTLAGLRRYNGLSVPAEYFDAAMDRMRTRHLNVSLDAVLHPVSVQTVKASNTEQTAAGAAPSVGVRELSASEWFERGYAALDFDEQLRCYSEAIRLKPEYATAFLNRGTARLRKRDPNGAMMDYTEAIRLSPDDASAAYNNRGVARNLLGDLDVAIEDHSEAIRLKPDYVEAYENRAQVYVTKGDLDGAVKAYSEAIGVRPDRAEAYKERGSVREAKGDLDGAIGDYTEAIRLKPDYVDAYHGRGHARLLDGDPDGAIEDYTRAIYLQPDSADAYNNRGVARAAKRDLDGALEDYSDAICLSPDHAAAYFNRGHARRDKGDLAGATKDYAEAKRLAARQR